MKLYLDKDTGVFTPSPLDNSAISEVNFRRGDTAVIELIFTSGNVALSAINDKTIKFGIKRLGNYEGGFLVYSNEFTMSGNSYIFTPSFNTVPLNEALNHNSLSGDDIASITGALQVRWESLSSIARSNAINAVISHDYISGDEGTPMEMPNAEDWLLTALDPLSASIHLAGSTNRFYYIGNGEELTVTAGTNSNGVNVLGQDAGSGASSVTDSNFIGNNAGLAASYASNSNFFGANAGAGANATNSNFMGFNAGLGATNANDSIFIGGAAGSGAIDAYNSIFIGNSAGGETTGSRNIIIGDYANVNPLSCSNCLVIGNEAGAAVSNTIALGSTSYPFLTAGSGTSTGSFLVVRLNGIDRKIQIFS